MQCNWDLSGNSKMYATFKMDATYLILYGMVLHERFAKTAVRIKVELKNQERFQDTLWYNQKSETFSLQNVVLLENF